MKDERLSAVGRRVEALAGLRELLHAQLLLAADALALIGGDEGFPLVLEDVDRALEQCLERVALGQLLGPGAELVTRRR